jgi:hypothetical protein
MKWILEIIERTVAVFLSVMSCMGMFLTGCLAGNMILGELSTSDMWAIFLGCLILTYGLIHLHNEVRYRRLEILADELELMENEEAQALYDHLTKGVT